MGAGAHAHARVRRSWLLIKHRDEWAGPLDIAEFAPLSVKSGGDFADILAEENPAIWESHRPAQGGDAGAMFARIIERALAIKAEREGHGAETPAESPRAPTVRARPGQPSATARGSSQRRATHEQPGAARRARPSRDSGGTDGEGR